MLFLAAIVAIGVAGCARLHTTPGLPLKNNMILDQLVVFSDTPLPSHHRLLEEIRTQRTQLSTKLGLPLSDEPIHVYLFPSAERLEAYMKVHYPKLPKRRAFFVESDTRLTVYAYWGDRVAEDLRHEVAHGYLHAVVPGLPLWLDEGLAEYFEVPRGQAGLNRAHVEQLSATGSLWQPDLSRLEQMEASEELTQAQYAESWLWAHFLLETSPERLQLLRGYLQSLARHQPTESLVVQITRQDPQAGARLVEHLATLRQGLR